MVHTIISKGTENVTLGFHTSTGTVSDVLLHALFINANTLILIKGPSKIFQKYAFCDFKKMTELSRMQVVMIE